MKFSALLFLHPTSMARLSHQLRRKIVQLSSEGMTNVKIRDILVAEEGVFVDLTTIKNNILRWRLHHTLGDLPRKTEAGCKIGLDQLRFIDQLISEDREITSVRIQKRLEEEFELKVTTSAIRKARKQKLQWVCSRPRYAQLIRHKNQIARLEYAIRCIETKDLFLNAIFTDECSVEIDHTSKIQFRRKGELPQFIGKPKHPTKVHVWAGISTRGATDIIIFDGIMESRFYCNHLLAHGLLPFARVAFPDGNYRFIQDNDPKHTSNFTKDFMAANSIPWWQTPPESPDLNPIEMVWHEMKHCLRVEKKPYTLDDLKRTIAEFWHERVTPEKCQKYIFHLQKVLPKVLEFEGKATGH